MSTQQQWPEPNLNNWRQVTRDDIGRTDVVFSDTELLTDEECAQRERNILTGICFEWNHNEHNESFDYAYAPVKAKPRGSVKIVVDLPELDGFEFTGEYRRPANKEYFFNGVTVYLAHFTMEKPYLIVNKIKRPAVTQTAAGKDSE